MNEAIASHERLTLKIGARKQIRQIISEVAAKYGMSQTLLLSQRRSRVISWPRQEVMYRAANETAASLPMIGQELGGMDHTTIIYGIRRHAARVRQAGANGAHQND